MVSSCSECNKPLHMPFGDMVELTLAFRYAFPDDWQDHDGRVLLCDDCFNEEVGA